MQDHDRHHRTWTAFILVMLLSGLWLGGCRPGGSAAIRTVSPPVSPASRTPVPVDPRERSPLVYISDQEVWEGTGIATDRLIARVPLTEIHAATALNESVLLLAKDALLLVDLSSGDSETVIPIDAPVRLGDLLPLRDHQTIAYAAIVDAGDNEENAWAGLATHVGLYDVRARQAHTLTVLPGEVALLGAHADGKALYIVRYGGDGGFSAVWGIDLASGAIREEIMASGFTAAVSPDGRWLIVAGEQSEQQGYMTLYDLMEPDTQAAAVELMPQPSQARALVWSPDSQRLYFILNSGTFTTPKRSYGVWELNPLDGGLKQITQSVLAESNLVMVSPDGRTLLIDNTRFAMVDIQTGTRWPLDLMPGSQILAWLAEKPK